MLNYAKIVMTQDVHYLEIQKVVTSLPGVIHLKTTVLPQNFNTIMIDIRDQGQNRRIEVYPYGTGSEYRFTGPFTSAKIEGEPTAADWARNLELAEFISSHFNGHFCQLTSEAWQQSTSTRDRPTLSPRDMMAKVLSNTVGFVKAAMFHELADNADALDVVAKALSDYHENTRLIDGIELDFDGIPELVDYEDGTDDLKAIWNFHNRSKQTIELMYRLPEMTFDARIISDSKPIRVASEYEVALLVDALPQEHKEAVKEWEHPTQGMTLR